MERSTLKLNELCGIANARVYLFGPPLAELMKRVARGLIRISAFRFDIRLFYRIFSGPILNPEPPHHHWSVHQGLLGG
jgi:hypothetical protein